MLDDLQTPSDPPVRSTECYASANRQLAEKADEPVGLTLAWRCHGDRPRAYANGKRFFEIWNGRYFALYTLEGIDHAACHEI